MVKIVWDTWTLKELKEKLHIDNLKDFLIMSERLKSQKDELILKWQEECKHELCELKRDIALFKKELEDTLYNENKEGFFRLYKEVVRRLANIIQSYNNNYKHPLTLASTIIEGALHQQFIKQHFKTLTNCTDEITPTSFFIDLTLNSLANER